jgi:hypothetical protein
MTTPANTVSISTNTINILTNFARINPGLRFNTGIDGQGSKLISIDPSASMIAHATITEVLPKEFFIYDLNRFLNMLKHPAFKDGTIEFDTNYLTLTGKGSDNKTVNIVYHYSSDMLDYFKGTPGYNDLPEVEDPSFSATVSKEQLDNFLKAATALNHKNLILKVDGGVSYMVASSSKTTSSSKNGLSDDYTQQVEGQSLGDSESCFPIEMLKVIPGNYTFTVDKTETSDGKSINRLLAHSLDLDLAYMVAESSN